ncbi:E3 ubiquitin-protein ligase XIAP-like, partial [Argopecten irradians]|uniref:E3 ubiquitin-protein ligase XIAP-like n=1 Tax=Argopecten irradians TaxID=31199 RepID=UPI00371B2252
ISKKESQTKTITWKVELSRLASFFFFPFNSPVSPTDLVKAGFYYEGNRDEVVCYKCRLKHHGWVKGDVPFFIHSTKSPLCPLVRSGDAEEVTTDQDDLIHQLEAVSISTPTGATGGHFDSDKYIKSYDQQKANNHPPSSLDINSNQDRKLYPQESHDRTSTEGSLPHSSINDTASPRTVQNTSSGTNSTTSGTNSTEYNECTSSIPSHPLVSANLVEDLSIPSGPNEELVEENEQEECIPVMESLGVTETRPKYPQFSVLAARLLTYRNWPSYLNQRPDQLANCGLFYTGIDDFVRCFYCGGGLREWEPHDDPWDEHARWFPFCTFMQQLKRDRFIVDVQSGKITSQLQLSMSMILNQDCTFDRQTVTRAMDMGYTTETIRKAIQMFFGKEFNKPLQCLIDMKDIEEKIKQKMTEDERIQREAEIEDLRMRLKCKVCLENELEMVFLPCCHLWYLCRL